MENININKLEKFVEENKEKEMTTGEMKNDLIRLKHSIFFETREDIVHHIKNGNPAMVAATAELLKVIS